MLTEVPHYEIHCKNCPNTMWLLIETLLRTFAVQGIPKKGNAVFGVVCPHCKLARNYSLSNANLNHGPKDHLVKGPPRELKTVFVRSFQCDTENCDTPLPIFALWSDTTTDEERQDDISTWQSESLHCLHGHPISIRQE